MVSFFFPLFIPLSSLSIFFLSLFSVQPEHFPFLQIAQSDQVDLRCRTVFYCALGRLLQVDLNDDGDRFERFIAPVSSQFVCMRVCVCMCVCVCLCVCVSVWVCVCSDGNLIRSTTQTRNSVCLVCGESGAQYINSRQCTLCCEVHFATTVSVAWSANMVSFPWFLHQHLLLLWLQRQSACTVTGAHVPIQWNTYVYLHNTFVVMYVSVCKYMCTYVGDIGMCSTDTLLSVCCVLATVLLCSCLPVCDNYF